MINKLLKPSSLPYLIGLSWLWLAIALYAVFVHAPVEKTQGATQKIFYLHLSFIFSTYLSLFVGALSSLAYLIKRSAAYDCFAHAAMKSAWLFCTGVLVSGSIWAKPIWGTWWTWDPRLTATLILWFILSAYACIRGYFAHTSRMPTIAAILALFALLDVPIIHFSVKLWRGIHPVIVSSGGLDESMKLPLAVSVTGMAAFVMLLTWMRYLVEKYRYRLNELEST